MTPVWLKHGDVLHLHEMRSDGVVSRIPLCKAGMRYPFPMRAGTSPDLIPESKPCPICWDMGILHGK